VLIRRLFAVVMLLVPAVESAAWATTVLSQAKAGGDCSCGEARFCRRQQAATEPCHGAADENATRLKCNCGAERTAPQLVAVRPYVMAEPLSVFVACRAEAAPSPASLAPRVGFARRHSPPPKTA